MMTKAELRKLIAAKRRALDLPWLKTASAEVVQNFQTLKAFQAAETVALYKAIQGEVILEPLFETCWKLGKRTCIPVFNSDLKIYLMAEITAETEFITGHYGIQEPASTDLTPVEDIDLMAVPGVMFDPAGNRLGRGGGYYDRLLEKFSGISAAVAFDFQIIDAIPVDPHDIPVDFLISQTKIAKV